MMLRFSILLLLLFVHNFSSLHGEPIKLEVVTPSPKEAGRSLAFSYGVAKKMDLAQSVEISFSAPIPYADALVFCGQAFISGTGAPVDLAVDFYTADGKKLSAVCTPASRQFAFHIPLRRTKTNGTAKLSADDKLIRASISLAGAPVNTGFSLENLRFVQNKRLAYWIPAPNAQIDEVFEGRLDFKKEMVGIHPRLFVSDEQLNEAAARYIKEPSFFQQYLPMATGLEMTTDPATYREADPTAAGAASLLRIAAAYRITGENIYLERLKLWQPVLAAKQPILISSLYEGNGDLTSGETLFCLAVAYDILKKRVDAGFDEALRQALIAQARQTYIDLLAVQSPAYMQNHYFTPVGGLLAASVTLADENPEAIRWAVWSRNMLRRCIESFSTDGWCFESIAYWQYIRYPLLGAIGLKNVTGETLFSDEYYRNTALYLAHIYLPDPDFVFDFGDCGPRVEAGGKRAQEGYDWPWHTYPVRVPTFPAVLIQREAPSSLLQNTIQKVFLYNDQVRRVDASFNMLLQTPRLSKPVPMPDDPKFPPFHYFPDLEVLHWRNNWSDPEATALAFKSGPPAGHSMAEFLRKYPGTIPNCGHAHPDAGAFILFAKGSFLATDTGYTGKKETADHNSLLVDGIGQHRGGTPWQTFEGKPYDEYNKIKMTNVWLTPDVAAGTAEFEAAYVDTLRLKSVRRDLIMIKGRYLLLVDRLSSEMPHEYEWRLHSDKKAAELDPNSYVIENGHARLIVKSLLPTQSRKVEPTIVETELYDRSLSRPQQRGFHITLKSPKLSDFGFATAMCIQNTKESASLFKAVYLGNGRYQLQDGESTCTVWMGESTELQGNFAYVLRNNKGEVLSSGISGKILKTKEGVELKP